MPIRPEYRRFYRGEAWKAVREQVRARAGDKCEHCRKPNGIFGVQCGAAHLNSVPGDDRLENLVWLCRGCHLRFDMCLHVNNARLTRQATKDRARPLLQEVS